MNPTSLQTMAATASDLICTLDASWAVADVNPAFADRLGWSDARSKGRQFTDFVFPEDRRAVRAALSEIGRAKSSTEVRCRCVRADGSVVWVDWRASTYEGAFYAIGREMSEKDDDIAMVVARAVRQQVATEERRRAAAEQDREQSHKQALESEHRAAIANTKARTMQTWVAAIITVATAVGGGAVWAINRVEVSALKAREAEEHRAKIDGEIDNFTKRIDANEKKIQKLGRALIETQIQLSDGTEYLADKIDAINPRVAGKVDPPPTVRLAKERLDEFKRTTRIDELFSDQIDDPITGGTDGP